MNCPVCDKLFSKKSGVKGDKAKLMCEAIHDILHNRVIRRVVATNDGSMIYLKVEATYENSASKSCSCAPSYACSCSCIRCCGYCNSVGKRSDGSNCSRCSCNFRCRCR